MDYLNNTHFFTFDEPGLPQIIQLKCNYKKSYIGRDKYIYKLIETKQTLSSTLTFSLLLRRCMGMEDAKSMDKFIKFNHAIFLFIKKIKNLSIK